MKEYLGRISLLIIFFIFIGCKLDKKKTESAKTDMATEKTIKSKSIELLVGTFASAKSNGIYKIDFDPQSGLLSNKTLLVERENPGYLYISKDRSMVYSSNGVKPGSISTYEFTKDRSQLNLISNNSSEGDGACFIELNGKENLLATANYGSGSIAVYKLDKKGHVVGEPQGFHHKGSGPHPNQKSAHAHCVKFDASGNYLYAVDLGIDEIVSYEISGDGKLASQLTALKTDPGDGPRHMIFHPEKDMVFIINELSSSVISATINKETGDLERIDKQSTLPDNFKGANACADIHLSRDGKFLYASNRGHNSIAIFSVSDKGELKLLDTEPVHGDWPRNFTLSPDGNFLLVANQKSDNITVFNVDTHSGLLSYIGKQIEIYQPVCLKFYITPYPLFKI